MKIPADLWSNPRPELLIEVLERRQLDQAILAQSPLFGQIDGTDFVRVKEIRRLQSADELWDRRACSHRCAEELLSGLYGVGVAFAYLVVGKPNEIAIYLGLRDAAKYGRQGDTLLHNALSGLLPGIRLDDSPKEAFRLGQRLDDASYFARQGMMTGIPSLKRPAKDAFPECPWDHLLRALCGEVWGCFVLAKPVPMQQIVQTAQLASEGRRLYSFHAREQMQKGPGVTVEVEGGPAHDALELLKRTQERIQVAKAEGMWEVAVYFFAPSEVTIRKMASLLRSTFAGEDSRPEPIRTLLCSSGRSGSPEQPNTSLNSRELAILIQLPQEERPGYTVREFARFDVALSDRPIEQPVTVGRVLDGTEDTGNVYAIERADLAKHTLIAGVTGSGKTNTCFHLLDQVWQRSKGVPFLVIEPAKTEYRDLLKVKDKRGRLIFPGLRVFTLGSEQGAPFRLNPFEFEILDEEHGIHVQTHIDYLKSVFNATFILYAPMPYVLERCLHEGYRDRGWDLATGVNRRIPKVKGPLPPEVFPTLTDLYNKIGEVVDALGYEERIRMDVRAALETRMNSLRVGGKGLMLDTRQSVPTKELLARPTILELESIGDDDEKAFVIGLLLARLYEYRVAQAKQWKTQGRRPSGLQHVTVIEEAHRLLRHVPVGAHPEVANVRGKAVETFANMIAEIRAYGEGVIVAEQIPAKLAPEVVKNTNLKVLHRLVAQDDRQLVGSTMNLDDAQRRFVTTLHTGQAVVFAEGDDGPFLVALDEHPATKSKGMVADQDVAALMQSFCSGGVYDPYLACPKHCQAMAANGGRCSHHIRHRARSIADQPSVRGALALWVLSVVEDAEQFIGAYPVLRDTMRRLMAGHRRQQKAVLLCALIQGVDLSFERKMRQYDWLLNVTKSLKAWLLVAGADLVHQYDDKHPDRNQQILDRHRDKLDRFSQGYQQQCGRDIGPYRGCDLCTRKCLYRYEVQRVVDDPLLQDRLLRALRSDYNHEGNALQDNTMWQQVRRVCLDAASQAIRTNDEDTLGQVALCYAASIGPALGFRPAGQEKLARGVAVLLEVR